MWLESLRLQELKKKSDRQHDNSCMTLISYTSIVAMMTSALIRQTRSTQKARRTENLRFTTSAGVERVDMCFGLEIIKMWHFYERQPTKFLSDILMIEMKARACCAVRSAAKAIITLPVSILELRYIRGVFKSRLTSNKPMTCYNGGTNLVQTGKLYRLTFKPRN